MLVTQRTGALVVVSADGASVSAPVAGVPAVVSGGQGGLLDVALDPDFETAGFNWIYIAYAEAAGAVSGTAVARGRLDLASNRLTELAVLFRQVPKISAEGHYGSRLAFGHDKTLFITLGERQQGEPAQILDNHLGKVVRINRDGSIPSGNGAGLPAGTLPEIWSVGHRNPQGAAVHPVTGELWQAEHGPSGGDELNLVRSGNNLGWPRVSYGCHVQSATCEIIGGGTHAPTYTEPVSRWPVAGTPRPYQSIAPSGIAFYTGRGFPEWNGNVFVAALADRALWRVVLNGNSEAARERLFGSLNERIRCVREGRDGWLYFLTDSGRIYRVDRG